MDKIFDFFKDLKERFSNPLFTSFILSWIIINWKICVGLIFYNVSELKLDGYDSYLDLITKNIDTKRNFGFPLLISISYTFAFPFLRNIINAFYVWIKAWGNNWNLSLSKTSRISISKYIELREVYEKRTSLLQSILTKESEYLQINEELKNSNLDLVSQKNSLTMEIEKLKMQFDVSLIDGLWEYIIPEFENKAQIVGKFYIRNGFIEHVFDNSRNSIRNKEEILNFVYNINAKQMSFVIVVKNIDIHVGRENIFRYYHFDVLDNIKTLRGMENQHTPIEYRRVG